MAVIKHTEEIKARVSYKRMFKALTLEAQTLLPKAVPTVIKSIDMLGDGSPGTLRQTNLVDGTIKHRLDALDLDKCTSKYTLIEGDGLDEKLEFINYEAKFEDSGDGGCVLKIVAEYHTKGDVVFKEEDIKERKDKGVGIFTAVEEYLMANPNACA